MQQAEVGVASGEDALINNQRQKELHSKRRAAAREREAQLAQAEENLRRLKEEVAVGIERSYNEVERTRNLVQVATR